MPDCSSCAAKCHEHGDCPAGGSLELTKPEIDYLLELAQIPFAPAARKASDMVPHGIPDSEEMTLVLQCLEKKNLISIDYRQELKGFDYSAFPGLPVHGSTALTERGQQVLELMEIQGIDTED